MREVSPRRSNCSMHDHRHGHLFESARETPPVYPVCRISPKADLLLREKNETWTYPEGSKCSGKEWPMRLTILAMEPTYLLSRDLPW